jgi:DnaJ-class molecular chaperone
MSENPYDVLGVEKSASTDEIRHAYRRAAAAEHPDRGGSHTRMAAVNGAYALLSDQHARAHYDQHGEAEKPKPPIDVAATAALTSFFDQALDKAPEHVDLIEAIKQGMTQTLANIANDLHQIRTRRDRDARRGKRLKYQQAKSSHDMLTEQLKTRAENFERQIADAERAAEILKRAIEMIQDFKWEDDRSVMASDALGEIERMRRDIHVMFRGFGS